MNFSYDGINTALQGLSRKILECGEKRNTRQFLCYEFPYPVMIEIKNPQYRYCTIKERKWNVFLPYMESLWLAAGRNDMEMAGAYVKKLFEFSDDGEYMRAGYGPRLRRYNNSVNQYRINQYGSKDNGKTVDQYKFVYETLKKDLFSRQACITIHDPVKDDFDIDGSLLVTKDQPCTRLLQFMVRDGCLDLTVYMRSNDLLWGFSAVNLFNFTFMQEYFSYMVGVPVGKYYHVVNNLHVYEWGMDMIRAIADASDYKEYEFKYGGGLLSLDDFDIMIKELSEFETDIRTHKEYRERPEFSMDFFNDWKNVFVRKHLPDVRVEFKNSFLGEYV